MIAFRALSESDLDEIMTLRRRCYGDEDLEKQNADFWRWQFSAPEGSATAYVAEDDGRIVAHLAQIPQTYAIGGTHLPALLTVDAMTAPEARGRGLYSRVMDFSLRASADRYRMAIAYWIRKVNVGPLTRNGYVERLRTPIFVRPLSWRALLGRVTRRAGNPSIHEKLDTSSQLGATDTAAMEVVSQNFFPKDLTHQIRSASYLEWRYFKNPVWKYEVLGRREGGTLVAFIVTRRVTLRGFDTLAVVDIAWSGGHRRDASALLRSTLRRGASNRLELAAALMSSAHPAVTLLLRHGFLPGPHRFRVTVRPLDDSIAPDIANSRWALTWGDTDHL